MERSESQSQSQSQSVKHMAARVPSIELQSSKSVVVAKPLLKYVLIISLCAFTLGWDLGSTGNLMDLPTFRARLGVSAQVTGLLISVFNMGCICACIWLFMFKPTRKWGHLASFRISLLTFLLGSFVAFCGYIEGPSSVYIYALGRFVQGISAGASCVVGPIFIDHICTFSKKKIMFLAVFQIMIGVFVLCGNCMFIYVGEYSELAFYAMTLVVPSAALALSGYLPESPRDFHTLKDVEILKESLEMLIEDSDKYEVWACAVNVLKHIHMRRRPKSDDSQTSVSGSPKTATNTIHKQRLALCCLLQVFQQTTGANFFFYFGKTMFDSLIVMPTSIRFAGLLLSTCNLLGAAISGFLIRSKGARKPLFYGSIGMSVLLLAFATMGVAANYESPVRFGIPMLVTSCVFLFIFAMSWGPCTAVIIMEICQANERILSVSVICGWVTNVLVVSLFPLLVESVGLGALYGFFAFTMVSVWTTRKDFRFDQALFEDIED